MWQQLFVSNLHWNILYQTFPDRLKIDIYPGIGIVNIMWALWALKKQLALKMHGLIQWGTRDVCPWSSKFFNLHAAVSQNNLELWKLVPPQENAASATKMWACCRISFVLLEMSKHLCAIGLIWTGLNWRNR